MRRHPLYVWTDYPFPQLGDEESNKAPIRRVNVVAYDRDKYCTVICAMATGHLLITQIKRGYLYIRKGRYGKTAPVPLRQLLSLPAEANLKLGMTL